MEKGGILSIRTDREHAVSAGYKVEKGVKENLLMN